MRQSGDGGDDGNGDALAAALAPLGYRIALIKTRGGGRATTHTVCCTMPMASCFRRCHPTPRMRSRTSSMRNRTPIALAVMAS